jgi:hypothetical protein
MRFGGIGQRDLVALVDTCRSIGAAGLATDSAIRFFTTQGARVRGNTHADFLTEPTTYT